MNQPRARGDEAAQKPVSRFLRNVLTKPLEAPEPGGPPPRHQPLIRGEEAMPPPGGPPRPARRRHEARRQAILVTKKPRRLRLCQKYIRHFHSEQKYNKGPVLGGRGRPRSLVKSAARKQMVRPRVAATKVLRVPRKVS